MLLALAACVNTPVLPGDTGHTGAPEDGAQGEAIVVGSLNLHCLKLDGFERVEQRLEAVAELLEGADVVALQEVCVSEQHDALVLLEEALEASTGEDWHGAWTLTHVAWEGTEDEADEGVALLARQELGSVEERTHAAQTGLTRVMLSAELEGLRVSSVHFDHQDAAVRLLQAREAGMDALLQGGLLVGDFNASPHEPAMQSLFDAGFVDLSEGLDEGRIDHVLAHRGEGWSVRSAELIEGVSDHPLVLVELERGEAVELSRTRMVAQSSQGWLSVRGDRSPLDWEAGWPGIETSPGVWEAVFTELEGSLEYKWLVRDSTWQSGENSTAEGGSTSQTSPVF